MVYHHAVSFPCSSDCLRGWRALFGPNTGCRNEISMQLRIFCSIRFKTSLYCFACYLHSKTRTSLPHLEFKKRHSDSLLGNQTTVPNPPTSSKLLRFYLMSKVCPNSFAVAYNNKAYALFSSRRLR